MFSRPSKSADQNQLIPAGNSELPLEPVSTARGATVEIAAKKARNKAAMESIVGYREGDDLRVVTFSHQCHRKPTQCRCTEQMISVRVVCDAFNTQTDQAPNSDQEQVNQPLNQ